MNKNPFFVNPSSDRKYITCIQGTVEAIALATNTVVRKEIRAHRYFERLVDGVSEVASVGNCILGLQKDLKEDVQENLLIIKFNQGNSQEEAMRECEKILWDETIEVIRHSKLLLQAFPNDRADLTNYIKLFFNMLNNITMYHLKMSDRYKFMQIERFKLPFVEEGDPEFEYIFKELLPIKAILNGNNNEQINKL
jgi:uncharacterized protein YihD (DUF1040 family)